MLFQSDSAILVVFCRRPALGIGKQRIARDLGAKHAFEAAQLLLHCALADAQSWTGPVVIAPASATDADWAADLLPGAYVIPQPTGATLGQRLSAIESQIRAQGGTKIVFIGSDSPALNPSDLACAAAMLEQKDAVIIPAADGGVTLMGSRQRWPDLVTLPWETSGLCKALHQSCTNAAMQTAIMPTSFDIDTKQDLFNAAPTLINDDRPSRRKLHAWIAKLASPHQVEQQHAESISVIIPVLNDTEALETLLRGLQTMITPADNIIVVDGNNHARCRRVCERYNARHIGSNANRGLQLRLGADNAKGEILWFLHADSEPSPAAIKHIRSHLAAGNISGYFRFRFGGERRWYKKLLERMINWRAMIGTPYGDQGLFVLRKNYLQANGHAATPLFEEVNLIKSLRKQRGCEAVAAAIMVSPRRWERDGWIMRSLHNRWLALGYAMGVAPERLAQNYRQPAANKNDAGAN